MENRRINSTKRTAILNYMMETKEHPSAEMIHEVVKKDFPDISLGTVYRNLCVLVESGDITSIGNVDGKERYDFCTKSHPHFVCRNCRRVLDLEYAFPISDFFDDIEKSSGFVLQDYSLEFHGLCNKCS